MYLDENDEYGVSESIYLLLISLKICLHLLGHGWNRTLSASLMPREQSYMQCSSFDIRALGYHYEGRTLTKIPHDTVPKSHVKSCDHIVLHVVTLFYM